MPTKSLMLQRATAKLRAKGIVTVDDLSRYAETHPTAEGHIPSRYSVLKAIVGADAADWLMNDLAIRQCCTPPKSR